MALGFQLMDDSIRSKGLWSVYTLSPEMQVQREVVEIVHYEDNYAYVSGTLKKET